jgi:ubiquinone/menaquinone biosynthesis C-methylase UbiE
MFQLLRLTLIYNFVQSILGAKRSSLIFLDEYIKPAKHDKVLDFGSGSGKLFHQIKDIPGILYVGIEPNARYVNYCQDLYRNYENATFHLGSIEVLDLVKEKFDTIVICAVLHHLNTNDWPSIIKKMYLSLNPGGKIVLLDTVFHPNQGFISKLLGRLDRGQSVINIHNYLDLISGNYEIKYDIRTDLLKIPYSHIITTIK